MKMGNRRAGRSPSSFSERVIRRRIESSKQIFATAEETVEFLRSNFPDYGRIKLQPFTRTVQQTLDHMVQQNQTNNNNNKSSSNQIQNRPSTSNALNDDLESPARKKLKKIDAKEERLRLLETNHLRKMQKDSSSSSSYSDSVSTSSGSSEEEDGAVSTSEDAIFGEKFEPEVDLMKSMLRDSYSGSKSDNKKPKGSKIVELEEIVDDKSTKKINYIQAEIDLQRKDGKGTSSSGGGGGADVKTKFRDLGGMSGVVEELKMEVIVPLYHPQLPQWLGVRPMAGILLHGPPGCGKTKLAHAIANETGVPFYKISATELVSGVSGASEENIRELFAKAYRTAPSIVFIDEIDAIASKRENLQREMERRIVTQLMTCMDESHRLVQPTEVNPSTEGYECRPGYVLVIGATNRPDAVDAALRRPGRFDREIILGVPDESARVEILSVLTRKLRVEGTFDLVKIARSTPGFVGADLAALANKAGNLAMKRIIDRRKSELLTESTDGDNAEEWWRRPWLPKEMEELSITMFDFEEAAKMVQPSSRREGFSAIPNVKWEDVGGLDSLRLEFDRYIVRRIKNPEDYKEFGVDLETGFLLYGPPGCGKTLIAKAVANEAGANFIHIKGPELLNKYVGESELAVRTIFSRARTCSPCILFFDEVDALTTKRGKEGGWVVERLLNQLLIELDGAEQRRGVYVIGATNRPEVMDRAVLRPGRFGKLLYVPLPSPDERGMILKALSRGKPIDASVDLIAIGRNEACENLSGADLSALMNEAAMTALEERLALDERLAAQASSEATALEEKSTAQASSKAPPLINTTHINRALSKISPSVSEKQKEYYQRLMESFGAP